MTLLGTKGSTVPQETLKQCSVKQILIKTISTQKKQAVSSSVEKCKIGVMITIARPISEVKKENGVEEWSITKVKLYYCNISVIYHFITYSE